VASPKRYHHKLRESTTISPSCRKDSTFLWLAFLLHMAAFMLGQKTTGVGDARIVRWSTEVQGKAVGSEYIGRGQQDPVAPPAEIYAHAWAYPLRQTRVEMLRRTAGQRSKAA